MIVSADEYLDRRRPEWADAERAGRVRFDRTLGRVCIEDAAIIALAPPQVAA